MSVTFTATTATVGYQMVYCDGEHRDTRTWPASTPIAQIEREHAAGCVDPTCIDYQGGILEPIYAAPIKPVEVGQVNARRVLDVLGYPTSPDGIGSSGPFEPFDNATGEGECGGLRRARPDRPGPLPRRRGDAGHRRVRRSRRAVGGVRPAARLPPGHPRPAAFPRGGRPHPRPDDHLGVEPATSRTEEEAMREITQEETDEVFGRHGQMVPSRDLGDGDVFMLSGRQPDRHTGVQLCL
ncbi:hypothetical protein [Frankia sp. EAN1pec]|uniref:hypothetical protein n=1 Tax=Parafrankia sp. (strain EAN1pec) TaxID=298653 RepID=UPI00059D30FF